MSGYATLGPRPATATADTTGLNPGNWTVVLPPNVINIQNPQFELFHMFIKSPQLPNAQTTAEVLWNTYFWDATLIGQLNSWDPAQPMPMTPGDTISVLFNVPTSMTPAPMITCYFRYAV